MIDLDMLLTIFWHTVLVIMNINMKNFVESGDNMNNEESRMKTQGSMEEEEEYQREKMAVAIAVGCDLLSRTTKEYFICTSHDKRHPEKTILIKGWRNKKRVWIYKEDRTLVPSPFTPPSRFIQCRISSEYNE
jgi:hypothetical protein